jgi:hypothetical protein
MVNIANRVGVANIVQHALSGGGFASVCVKQFNQYGQ